MKYGQARQIGDLLTEYARKKNWDESFFRIRLFAVWDELMCDVTVPPIPLEEAARITSSKQYKDRVLTCRITSSVMRAQLQFGMPRLRAELNRRMGTPCVDRIVLI